MHYEKFDVAKLERLNDPARFEDLDPDVMWAALGQPSARVIVDIGAGTGLFAERFARMAPGATVYAADMEPVMVEWMQDNRAAEGHGAIVPVLAEETRVPLDDRIADVVAMINLHHELADPVASCAEAWRLLAPGGTVMVADWLPGVGGERPPEHIRVPAESIAGCLAEAGFTDVAVHHALARHSLVTGRKAAGSRMGKDLKGSSVEDVEEGEQR